MLRFIIILNLFANTCRGYEQNKTFMPNNWYANKQINEINILDPPSWFFSTSIIEIDENYIFDYFANNNAFHNLSVVPEKLSENFCSGDQIGFNKNLLLLLYLDLPPPLS